MNKFALMVLCVTLTAASVGCAPEPGEEVEELACLQVGAAETCVWPSIAEIDAENQRFVFPYGWMAVYATAETREESYELEDEKSVELEEYFPDGPDEYLGWGLRGQTWTYDLYRMHETDGDMFVLTGVGFYENEDGTATRYALIWSYWYGTDRSELTDLFSQFVAATEIVDWN